MDLVVLLDHLGARDRRVTSRPGTFTPVGVMVHHTASANTTGTPSLWTCQKGRIDLPGPLCNVLIGRDASINVITDGRANDSGGGDPDVLAAIRVGLPLPAPNDTTDTRIDGNPWFYDIEVENDGVGEPYHPSVLEATGRVAAAICAAHGWGANRVLLHREWTRRKIDWSWTGDTRALVATYLYPAPREAFMALSDAEQADLYGRIVAMHERNWVDSNGHGDLAWLDAKLAPLVARLTAIEAAVASVTPGAVPDVKAAVKEALKEGTG